MNGNHTPSECKQYGIRENYHECSENTFLNNEMIMCSQWIYKDPENTIVREVSVQLIHIQDKVEKVKTFN
jgi:hypothetical protein